MSLFDQIRGPRQQPAAQPVDNVASGPVVQQPQSDDTLNEWDDQSVPQVKQTVSDVQAFVNFLEKRYGYPLCIVRSCIGTDPQHPGFYTYECIHGGDPRRNKQIESASTSASATASASASTSTDAPDTSTVSVNDAAGGNNDGQNSTAAGGRIVLAQPKQRASMKVGCLFMVKISALKNGKWRITMLNLNHTLIDGSLHPPVYSSIYLTDEFKQTLLNSFNTGNSISLTNVIRVVAAQKRIEDVATNSEYNVLKSYVRYHTRGSAPVNKQLQDVFDVILNSADAIFKPLYGTAVENNSRTLRGVFLSNQRLLGIGKKFADVILFDTTYSIASPDYHLTIFTVVTSHLTSLPLAYAINATDDTTTYTELLQYLVEKIGTGITKVIITDNAKSIIAAVSGVFGGSVKHVQCIFHRRLNWAAFIRNLTEQHLAAIKPKLRQIHAGIKRHMNRSVYSIDKRILDMQFESFSSADIRELLFELGIMGLWAVEENDYNDLSDLIASLFQFDKKSYNSIVRFFNDSRAASYYRNKKVPQLYNFGTSRCEGINHSYKSFAHSVHRGRLPIEDVVDTVFKHSKKMVLNLADNDRMSASYQQPGFMTGIRDLRGKISHKVIKHLASLFEACSNLSVTGDSINITNAAATSVPGCAVPVDILTIFGAGSYYHIAEKERTSANGKSYFVRFAAGKYPLCSCFGPTQAGLPCSHILCLLQHLSLPLTVDHFAPRWHLSVPTADATVAVDTPSSSSTSTTERRPRY
ncbi:hypothetical protein GQ42DRAFT_152250 [Ramicandelaber brevisporus]|nr:hypothetical protein GQ42DRAFT_152250 [Ramicandelaber brevisporus]